MISKAILLPKKHEISPERTYHKKIEKNEEKGIIRNFELCGCENVGTVFIVVSHLRSYLFQADLPLSNCENVYDENTHNRYIIMIHVKYLGDKPLKPFVFL